MRVMVHAEARELSQHGYDKKAKYSRYILLKQVDSSLGLELELTQCVRTGYVRLRSIKPRQCGF